ncbi:MAG: leucine-rich repeat domain-containing protein [Ruminococcus sp.]|nr:leucine-rich repeat domain-containing protein [Ruminococcus sp.]
MRKIALFFTVLALAAAAVSCAGKTSEAPSEESSEESVLIIDPDGNILDEKPTETTRATVDEGDFEYEVTEGRAVVTKYNGKADEVQIPEELGGAPVCEISYYAFEAKYDIKKVVVPETVDKICECAFMDCSSLEQINIPEAVTKIERGAFVACTSLRELTIPAACTEVQEEAFTACESMTALTINNPDLAYQSWGLEELPDLKIIAPEGSAVYAWAQAMGKA